jgi:hypothetical protein
MEDVNNLTLDLDSLTQGLIFVIHHLSIFLLNVISYAYIMAKFFKVLCYSRMTFEWLPMINPYIWPFSFFHIITGPYFSFWSRVLPNIKLDKSSVEVSGIIALEALNSLVYFFIQLTSILIRYLDATEENLLDSMD